MRNKDRAEKRRLLVDETDFNKEVFVKHEQAPTAPKLEGVWVYVDLKYISYENRYFWPIWQLPVGCFLTEMFKKHIYGLRPFIWAYNQVSKRSVQKF